jgi:hypothetical protein
MSESQKNYSRFVMHPRYGQSPIESGLNPQPFAEGVHLTTSTKSIDEVIENYEAVMGQPCPLRRFRSMQRDVARRIPNTAVEANTMCQARTTIPVTHYFDLEAKCRDCGRYFIFFAQEQKYWYEELQFPLDASCVLCVECRKKRQHIARKQKIYETLFHEKEKTEQQLFEMIDACLTLIEHGVFSKRQSQNARMLLNMLKKFEPEQAKIETLRGRIHAIERGTMYFGAEE